MESPVFENEKDGLDISITLMREAFERQMGNIDGMRATFRTFLSASSVTITLLGTLALVGVRPDADWAGLYSLGMLTALGLYLGHVILCIRGLLPLKVKGPILDDWYVLYDSFMSDGVDARKTLLNQYLSVLKKNDHVLVEMAAHVRWAGISLGAAVAIILALSVIPRFMIQ